MINCANDLLHRVDSYPDNYQEIKANIRRRVDCILAGDPMFNGISFDDLGTEYIAVHLYAKDMGPHPIGHCYIDIGFQGVEALITELYYRWARDSTDDHRDMLKRVINSRGGKQ